MAQIPSGTKKPCHQPLRPASANEPDGATRPLTRFIALAAGSVLMLAGAIGLILPVVPGAVLIAAGFAVLSAHCGWIRRAREEYGGRFQVPSRLVAWLDALRIRVDKARRAVTVAISKYFLEVR